MKPAWAKIPVDVVLKMAFFIPDADTLFAVLEALQPYNVLGPLEHLHRLGLVENRLLLWPSLVLNPSILDSVNSSSYEAIAKFYSEVVVENVWHDVAWLQTYLNPKAKMQWRVTNPPESMEALNAWEDFHITQLTFFVNDAFPPY
ncbi:hypothetical protein LEN26_011328 [Aphanomyces euteiches]|nr:hypothetical protein LEN26_011328 [Aphanomyces euteiches]